MGMILFCGFLSFFGIDLFQRKTKLINMGWKKRAVTATVYGVFWPVTVPITLLCGGAAGGVAAYGYIKAKENQKILQQKKNERTVS